MTSKLLKVNNEVHFGAEGQRQSRASKLLGGIAKVADDVKSHKLEKSLKYKVTNMVKSAKKGPRFFAEKEPDAPEGTWWSGGKEAITTLDEEPERSSSNETVNTDEEQFTTTDEDLSGEGSEVEYVLPSAGGELDYGDGDEEGAPADTNATEVTDTTPAKKTVTTKAKPTTDKKSKAPAKEKKDSKKSYETAPAALDHGKTVGAKGLDPWADSSEDEKCPTAPAPAKTAKAPAKKKSAVSDGQALATKKTGKGKKVVAKDKVPKPEEDAGWGLGGALGFGDQAAPANPKTAPEKKKTKEAKKPEKSEKKAAAPAMKATVATPAPPKPAPVAQAAATKASPFDSDSDDSDIKF